MKQTERQQNLTSLQKFMCFSFLFHVFLLAAIFVIPYLKAPKPAEVEVVLIDQTPAEPTAKTEALEEQKNPTQVVQMDENQANNQDDKNAKYLSAKNNTVKKQTVAKNVGQFKNSAQTVNSAATKSSQQKMAARAEEKSEQQKQKPTSKLFDTGFDVYSSLNKNQATQKMAQKEHTFQNGSSEQKASANNDHVEDAEQSLMTQLNTREYKYYGYHKRIRTQLDQWYEGQLRDQLKKIVSQGRTIASEENKRTQLLIILNDKGNLVKVEILGVSGVKELDDAAVEAFRKAAPFPNPPKGMIDTDGTIKVRWDFVLS